MNSLSRFWNWWAGQWRGTTRLGKIAMLVVPLFLGCCGMTMLSTLVSPDVEPSAESAIAGERLATVDIAAAAPTADSPTAEPPTSAPTDEPTPVPATATARPSATRPPATPVPTAQPTAEPPPTDAPVQAATSVAATVAASQPTAVPPTSAPTLAPTAVPPTAIPPTAAPTTEVLPTATLPTATGALVIIGVDKRAEVVTIRNDGGAEVNLAGWILRSEKGPQDCALGGIIGPGQTLRIWAMTEDIAQGGYNCGFGSDIWNNSEPDAALLIDPSGAVVSWW